jgi:hypothetical protein
MTMQLIIDTLSSTLVENASLPNVDDIESSFFRSPYVNSLWRSDVDKIIQAFRKRLLNEAVILDNSISYLKDEVLDVSKISSSLVRNLDIRENIQMMIHIGAERICRTIVTMFLEKHMKSLGRGRPEGIYGFTNISHQIAEIVCNNQPDESNFFISNFFLSYISKATFSSYLDVLTPTLSSRLILEMEEIEVNLIADILAKFIIEATLPEKNQISDFCSLTEKTINKFAFKRSISEYLDLLAKKLIGKIVREVKRHNFSAQIRKQNLASVTIKKCLRNLTTWRLITFCPRESV